MPGRYNPGMDREKVIQILRDAMPELRSRFRVAELSLFGSFARGDNRPDSDVDVLVRFEPGATVTLFTLGGLLNDLEERLGRKVDVIEDNPRMRADFRDEVERDRRRVA